MNEDLIAYFDNRYVALRDAKVGILTHALNYGTGLFEGLRAYWNEREEELFLLRPLEHFERWKTNSRILRIEIPPAPEELCRITAELLRRNRFRSNVYVRPLAYKSAERIGVSPDDQDAFTIAALPFGDYLDSAKGLHAGVVSWRRIEDNAIPGRAKITGAYVNSALASDEARRNGFDEAIFLNEDGHLAEGASCNIFLVRGGKLITPAASDNILEGITRACVIELARQEMRLEVVERSLDRSELYVCDEMFFTGTAVEVAPVVQVDHRPVGAGAIGPVTSRLRRIYCEAVRGQLAAYRKWLLPVYHPPEAAGKAA
ncbi:MAG: branched-chain amino acid transaminase [Acidobacteria bacterium]|nr:branched-chain amino acid transaminase [Acidobacteriota bacterium]